MVAPGLAVDSDVAVTSLLFEDAHAVNYVSFIKSVANL